MRKITIPVLSVVIFVCGIFICQNTFAADPADKKDAGKKVTADSTDTKDANKKVAADSTDAKNERSDNDFNLNKKARKKPPVPEITYKPMNLGMPGNRAGGSGR